MALVHRTATLDYWELWTRLQVLVHTRTLPKPTRITRLVLDMSYLAYSLLSYELSVLLDHLLPESSHFSKVALLENICLSFPVQWTHFALVRTKVHSRMQDCIGSRQHLRLATTFLGKWHGAEQVPLVQGCCSHVSRTLPGGGFLDSLTGRHGIQYSGRVVARGVTSQFQVRCSVGLATRLHPSPRVAPRFPAEALGQYSGVAGQLWLHWPPGAFSGTLDALSC
jgi:hypothetical protein